MQKKRLNLYNVNMKYIRDLSKADDKVLSVSPQEGKEKRPFVGIIVICDKKSYCIPLSSPKAKHIKMNNDKVNLHISEQDTSQIAAYKHLMNDQLDWCNDNMDIICRKANKLYKIVTHTPEKFINLTRRCCDFKKLEAVLEKWRSKNI